MNSAAGQNGAGNSVGIPAAGNCGLESAPTRSELTQSVLECHNNNNNDNRNCNNSGDSAGSWKLLQQDPNKMNKLREIVENNAR